MKGILKLVLCLLALYLFATQLAPLINKTPLLKDLNASIEKWDINTAAFFYTDDISTKTEITKHTDL